MGRRARPDTLAGLRTRWARIRFPGLEMGTPSNVRGTHTTVRPPHGRLLLSRPAIARPGTDRARCLALVCVCFFGWRIHPFLVHIPIILVQTIYPKGWKMTGWAGQSQALYRRLEADRYALPEIRFLGGWVNIFLNTNRSSHGPAKPTLQCASQPIPTLTLFWRGLNKSVAFGPVIR